MSKHLKLIGYGDPADPVPTSASGPLSWEERLEDEAGAGTTVGKAPMEGVPAPASKIDVAATFVLDDEDQSTLHATGQLDFTGSRIGDGWLTIQGRGTGVFKHSKGRIEVKRFNPKRYTIPM